jgi:AcrR family transcriptional regulator
MYIGGGVLLRNRIMKAVIDEINENGIKFTMADLAKRVAVSKSTLYMHFTSKEEMVGAIVDSLVEKMQQRDEEIINNRALNLHEKLKTLLLNEPKILGSISNRFIHDLKRYMPEQAEKGECFQKNKWQMIESLLQQGMDTGYFREVDLSITKIMFNATINELMNPNYLMQSNLTVNDALGKMADILCFGLMAPDKNG